MKIGDEIEIKIDAMSFGSAAVGRHTPAGEPRAMVVFVDRAAPREKVRVRLTKNRKSYWEAELVEILEPSVDRVAPPCKVFGRCGGCQWQHLSYDAQVRAKASGLIHQLSRATRLSNETLLERFSVHPAASPTGYRSRLQVHGDKDGLGFYAGGSHKIVHTDKCLVAHPEIQRAWDAFAARKRFAELSKATGQFKVEWSRGEGGDMHEAINRKHGAFGFTQVNTEQNAVLVDIVTELAGTGAVLFDLYGGSGNLTDRLLDRFEHLVSVDSFSAGDDPVAFRGPLKKGRVFFKERIEGFLADQRWRDWGVDAPDCVIADPPRAGLGEAAARIAGLSAPRVVLVSCDPSTLGRDLTHFSAAGYEIEKVHLVDMFPQTYHVETVVLLKLS